MDYDAISKREPINHNKYAPLGCRVLLLIEYAAKTTASGIELAVMSTDRPQHARVVAAGPEVESLAVGDIVYISSYGGLPIEKNNHQELVMMDQAEPLALYNPDAAAPSV